MQEAEQNEDIRKEKKSSGNVVDEGLSQMKGSRRMSCCRSLVTLLTKGTEIKKECTLRTSNI